MQSLGSPVVWMFVLFIGVAAFFLGMNWDSKPVVYTEDSKGDEIVMDDQFKAQEPTPTISENKTILFRMEEILSIADPQEKSHKLEDFLNSIDSDDAWELYAYFKHNCSAGIASLKSAFFIRWGEIAGEEAYNAALSMDTSDRMTLVLNVLKGWMWADIDSAWEMALSLDRDIQSPKFNLNDLLGDLAERDLEKAYQLASESKVKGALYSMRVAAFETGKEEILLKLMLNDASLLYRNVKLSDFMSHLGELDFDRAVVLVDKIENTSDASEALYAALDGWAKNDPQEAFRFALENDSDPELPKHIREWSSLVMKSSTPEEIVELFSLVESSRLIEPIVSSVGPDLVEVSPSTIFELIDKMDNDQSKSIEIQKVFIEWSMSDSETAIEYYLSGKLDPVIQGRIFRGFYSRAGNRIQPNRMVELLESIPNTEGRVPALDYIESTTRWSNDEESDKEFRTEIRNRIRESVVITDQEKARVSNYWQDASSVEFTGSVSIPLGE